LIEKRFNVVSVLCKTMRIHFSLLDVL